MIFLNLMAVGAKRESTNTWWDQVWSTRLNNPLRDVRIVVQQRIHEKDMTGHILANDNEKEWLRLIIPIGELSQELLRVTRTKDGLKQESLLPVRFVPMVMGQDL